MRGVVARISLRKRKCHVIFRAFSFKFHWGVSRSLRNCRKDVIIWIRGDLRLLLVFRSVCVRLLLVWLLRILLMRNIDGIILIFFFSLLYQFCCFLRTFDLVFDEFRVTWGNLFKPSTGLVAVSKNFLVPPIAYNMLRQLLNMFIASILTWYLDHIISNNRGWPNDYLFFLRNSYWQFRCRKHQTIVDSI